MFRKLLDRVVASISIAIILSLILMPSGQKPVFASPLIQQPDTNAHIREGTILPTAGRCGEVVGVQATLDSKTGTMWQPQPGQILTFNFLDLAGVVLATNSGVTDAEGVARADLTVHPDTVTLQVVYAGDPFYDPPLRPAQAEVPFTVTDVCYRGAAITVLDAEGPYGGNALLQAQLSEASNGDPVIGRYIHFSINGDPVGIAMTDDTGLAALSASLGSLEVGIYPPGIGSGIEADYLGDMGFVMITGTATLTVTQATASLFLSDLAQTYDGLPKPATVTSDPPGISGVTVLYDGGPEAPVNAGSYLVEASLDNPNFFPATVTGILVIEKASQAITFAQPDSPQVYGATFGVNPFSNSDLPVTLTANGSCTADGFQVTMTSGTGSCTLTATQAGNQNFYPADPVTRIVQAAKASQSINFPQPPDPVAYGQVFTVNPEASSGLAVTLQTSGNCTNQGFEVTITGSTGTCTLNATQAGDGNYLPANPIVYTLSVVKADQTIDFPQPDSPAPWGSSFLVNPTASSGLDVIVEASGACSLQAADQGYQVTMTEPSGVCTLTATQSGNEFYNSAEVSVTVDAARAGQTILFDPPASPATYGTSFEVSPSATSGLPVTLAASGSCSVDGYVVTMTSGTGTCELTATQAGDEFYTPAEAVIRTVQAEKAQQNISFAAPASPAVFGTTFTISPTADSGLTVEVSAEGNCTIDGYQVTMTSGVGECTLTATQPGDDNFAAASSVVHIVEAAKAAQTIIFPQPSSPATYATSFTIHPTASSELPVEVSVEGSCAIDGYQVTMTSGTGECTLTATQAGSDDYLAAEAVIRKVDAAKASQSIQFDEPQSPVRRGTVFSVSPQATSGLPVVVTAEGSCTIDGYQVTVTGMSGYCTLTASQEGDENYLPAPNVVHAIEVIPDQMFVYLPLLVNLTH